MTTGDQWTIPNPTSHSLSTADSGAPAKPFAAETADQSGALLWGALVTDHPELKDQSPEHIQAMLTEWWKHSVEELSRKLPDFPISFRTTRFKGDIRYIENPLIALKPAFDSLRAGESSFWEAMDHLGRTFGWDKEKLLCWKRGLESLSGLIAWLPSFVQSRDYLMTAFPLGREEIDHIRESLLQSIEESYRFLEDRARCEFDEKFSEFKKRYMESYYLLHEDALHIASGLRKDEIKIDRVSLRNLDLLSGLQFMDRRFLNQVKLLGKWVQRNRCNLPLRQILESYPRCYCNFNPCSQQQPADAVALINGTMQDGIEYFRSHLRRCGYLIMAEVQTQTVDDGTLQPITALLSDGPMMPLKQQTIKLLNRIIGKYANEFLAEFRKK
jgi:hypothetical protein